MLIGADSKLDWESIHNTVWTLLRQQSMPISVVKEYTLSNVLEQYSGATNHIETLRAELEVAFHFYIIKTSQCECGNVYCSSGCQWQAHNIGCHG